MSSKLKPSSPATTTRSSSRQPPPSSSSSSGNNSPRTNMSNSTPGIINLPQPKNSRNSRSDSRQTVSASTDHHAQAATTTTATSPAQNTRSRNKSTRSRNSTAATTPADSSAPTPLRASSPLKSSTLAPAEHANLPLSSLDGGALEDSSTPTKSRNRRGRGRGSRQTSPPSSSTGVFAQGDDSSTFPQLPSDSNAHHHSATLEEPSPVHPVNSSLLSRSAPPVVHHQQQQQQRKGRRQPASDQRQVQHSEQSSSDEWDMPVLDSSRAQSAGQPKDGLTWQQESLGRSTGGRSRVESGSYSSVPSTRPGSRGAGRDGSGYNSAREGNNRNNNSNHHHVGGKQRPALHHGSISDSGGSLNWQQELLQQSAPSSASPTKQQFQHHQHSASGNITPAKSRRQQQRDEETFGLASLDLHNHNNDLFSPLQPQQQQHTPRNNNRRTSNNNNNNGGGQQQQHTPTKAPSTPAEPRYAGPTFHNSPLPSSLPTPNFMLRRKAMEIGV